MNEPLPDWRLPAGVTRGVWDYMTNEALVAEYDALLEGSPLCAADLAMAQRCFDRPGRLVDLGTGTGRIVVPFAARGFWVLGIDLSERMLAEAGMKAAREGVAIHRLCANLVDLDCVAGDTFDYATCLFSTLGMIADAGLRRQMIRHAFRILRPGGRLLLHVHNRWCNWRDPAGRRWLLKNLLGAAVGSARAGDKEMPVHGCTGRFTLHLFTRREILDLLRGCGFRVLECQAAGEAGGARGRLAVWAARLWPSGYLVLAERPTAASGTVCGTALG